METVIVVIMVLLFIWCAVIIARCEPTQPCFFCRLGDK